MVDAISYKNKFYQYNATITQIFWYIFSNNNKVMLFSAFTYLAQGSVRFTHSKKDTKCIKHTKEHSPINVSTQTERGTIKGLNTEKPAHKVCPRNLSSHLNMMISSFIG